MKKYAYIVHFNHRQLDHIKYGYINSLENPKNDRFKIANHL